MHSAVIIPFRGDCALLDWTLEGYANQQLSDGHTLELRIGLDGPVDPGPQPPATRPAIDCNIHGYPRRGAAAVRNALAGEISPHTDLLVFGNADARPAPDMVQRHADAMGSLPPGSLVLGAAPWEIPDSPPPTVFDALLAETPMIFFYHDLAAHHWYDYRHAWTLNLSVRPGDFRKAGGFHDELRPVYYEDLAFAYRLLGPDRQGVFYEPAARVTHRHPTSLDQYLDREELLGLMSPVLARVCPEAFAALHGTRDAESLAESFRRWTKMDHPMHRWIYRRLGEWQDQPVTALPQNPSDRRRLMLSIYQMHIPLKRLAFRLGYLRGMELVDDSRWTQRQPQSLWKQITG